MDGVLVEADGGFEEDWRSTGISYRVTVDSTASEPVLARLHAVVDEVAEIPRVIRAGTRVSRLDASAPSPPLRDS